MNSIKSETHEEVLQRARQITKIGLLVIKANPRTHEEGIMCFVDPEASRAFVEILFDPKNYHYLDG